MLKYRIMCKAMFTFLGLDFRDAFLISLYLVVMGKNQMVRIIISYNKICCQNLKK